MRLTEKDIIYITSGANIIEIPDIVEGHKYTGQAIIKLGQLEDIEEELGIDLITLFKALTNGFYYKDEFGDVEHLDKQTLHLLIGKKFQELKEQTKDYGKTWALTKEELL